MSPFCSIENWRKKKIESTRRWSKAEGDERVGSEEPWKSNQKKSYDKCSRHLWPMCWFQSNWRIWSTIRIKYHSQYHIISTMSFTKRSSLYTLQHSSPFPLPNFLLSWSRQVPLKSPPLKIGAAHCFFLLLSPINTSTPVRHIVCPDSLPSSSLSFCCSFSIHVCCCCIWKCVRERFFDKLISCSSVWTAVQ